MDPEGPAGGHQVGPGEGKGPYKIFLLAEKELEELESDLEDFSTDDHNEVYYSDLWKSEFQKLRFDPRFLLLLLFHEDRVYYRSF